MTKEIRLSAIVPDELAGQRLDKALARLFTEHSRARLQDWIKKGHVLLDQKKVNQRHTLHGGENIEVHTELEQQINHQSEAIPLDIVFEDEAILVINKPAGLVVHPGAGNRTGTLLNAILHFDPKLELVSRAGIVHRLDKDTTGLMIVARTPESHTSLVNAMQSRAIKREYQALVKGVFTAGGTVNQAIARHPKHRTRMAVVNSGKEAITYYRVLKRYRDFTLLNCELETGRTHQIRVHMAHIHHPIVGDPVYGGRYSQPKGCSDNLSGQLKNFQRQALHAWRLSLHHPVTAESMSWQVEPPEDFAELLQALNHEQLA